MVLAIVMKLGGACGGVCVDPGPRIVTKNQGEKTAESVKIKNNLRFIKGINVKFKKDKSEGMY